MSPLRVVGRFLLAYALLVLLWQAVEPFAVRIVADFALHAIWGFDGRSPISMLRSRDSVVTIVSLISGVERPLARWSAGGLHAFFLPGVAATLSVPGLSGRVRARLAVAATVLGFLVAVGVCAMQVVIAAQDEAASGAMPVGLVAASSLSVLKAASAILVPIATPLLPALLFLVAHAAFVSRTRVDTRGRSPFLSGRRTMVLSAALAGALAAGILLTPKPDALEVLGSLERRNPGSPHPRFSLGVHLEARGDLAGAEGAYRESLRIAPASSAVRYALGNVQFLQGDVAGAIASYRASLEHDSTQVSAHQNLGIALFRSGRFGEAAAEFEEAVRREPNHAAAHHNLGLALKELGRECEGLPHLRSSASLDGTFARDPAVHAEIAKLEQRCRPPRRG